MKYRIKITPKAERQIRKLSNPVQHKILLALTLLEDNPRPPGCKKLKGAESQYRIRIDDYRVIYRIEDQAFIVLTLKVAHRREIYR